MLFAMRYSRLCLLLLPFVPLLVSGSVNAEAASEMCEFLLGEWAPSGIRQPWDGAGSISFYHPDRGRRMLMSRSVVTYPEVNGVGCRRHQGIVLLLRRASGRGMQGVFFDHDRICYGHAAEDFAASCDVAFTRDRCTITVRPTAKEIGIRTTYARIGANEMEVRYEYALPSAPNHHLKYFTSRAVRKTKRMPFLSIVFSGCPPWTSLQCAGPSDERALLRAVARCSSLPLGQLREEVASFADVHKQDLSELSKIYVLNRYVFAVPDNVPQSKVRFFGGWSGVPRSRDGYNLRWPLSVTASGEFSIPGRGGGYGGPPYAALTEFD